MQDRSPVLNLSLLFESLQYSWHRCSMASMNILSFIRKSSSIGDQVLVGTAAIKHGQCVLMWMHKGQWG